MIETCCEVSVSLVELESVIERGLQTFVAVGEALGEISERKLYREQGFGTFEEYCKERWGWSRDAGYKYIRAAEVARNVDSSLQNPPSLTQARELSVLEPEEQREIAERVNFATTTVRELKEEITRLVSGLGRSIPPPAASVHFSSASEEWYTPKEVLDRAVKTLGSIDLDPCSNTGQPNVPSARHFTQAQDGLSREWSGTVYMNPPYGRAIVGWAEKLVTEHKAGNVSQAIALVPARVDTDWFRLFRDYSICFIDGRLKFSGHENSAPFPSAAIYLGGDIDKFYDAFSDLGDIWIRWQR